ncbi:MAG: hypothetical protein KDA90_04885 [Planctomycetaceae bacterium]|nr:hypothetical protein [Planctomycetaceae bacterium]
MNSKLPDDRNDSPAAVHRRVQGLCLLFTAFVMCGCGQVDGPQRAAVQGSVLLNGLPMPAGVIRFIPHGDTKGPKVTATIEVGHFDLPAWSGPLVGEHRVEIELRNNCAFAPDDEQALQRLQSLKRSQRPRVKLDRIPDCYNRRSELVAQISPNATNELNFELVSKR